MGEWRGACKVLVDKSEGRRSLGRHRRKWKIIFRWFFDKLNGGAWTGLIWLRSEAGGTIL